MSNTEDNKTKCIALLSSVFAPWRNETRIDITTIDQFNVHYGGPICIVRELAGGINQGQKILGVEREMSSAHSTRMEIYVICRLAHAGALPPLPS
jgi:hypothetical protein